jgi:hypothetical protein
MRHRLACAATLLLILPAPVAGASGGEVRSLDGASNNLEHPDWARAGMAYPRVSAANYADGRTEPVTGPAVRYVSNRIFNDTSQNLFSENGVTQWSPVWGQFLDHTFGLRQAAGGERTPLAYDPADPLEGFDNDLGSMSFTRTPAAPGTGVVSPREQLNGVGGYIDASVVYGDTPDRLRWLREDRAAGAGARLLLPESYLPRADARGNAATAPPMELFSRLHANPAGAVEAGDVRANESVALTATHTLFAREHNRVADDLPRSLSEEERFQIARRVVGAEQQYVTYNEFLPALGVRLPAYRGYDPDVNAAVTNEFAVVGYRAHSMVHGELETSVPVGTFSPEQLDSLRAQGVEVAIVDGLVALAIPLNVSFGNPDLLQSVGLGPVLAGIGGEPQYKNDEQIDNQLRSVLFGVPKPGVDATACLDGRTLPQCFTGVTDLAALDIARTRDHGMPSYNDLRRAYGLRPRPTFTAITGESTDEFDDPLVDAQSPLGDPEILDFVSLRNAAGDEVAPDSPEAETDVVTGTRRTPLAARLRALYGDVDQLDAFVGMSADQHVPGTEFGDLQLAIWAEQFAALRDGDRFFYASDPELARIERRYGISYRRSLAEIIERNTGQEVQPSVFEAAG